MVSDDKVKPEVEEEVPDPPRNFTLKQLAHFDGTKESRTLRGELVEDEDPKPVYLSINTTVFDVSDGKNFYGPGGPYENFAGHECGVALAKMDSAATNVDVLEGIATLKVTEHTDLEGWIEKFTYYRNYPIVGKYVPATKLADPEKVWTKEELETAAENDPAPQPTPPWT